MQKIDGQIVTVKLDQEMVEELDRLSKRLDLKRNQFIRNLLGMGLDIVHGYERIGVVKLVEVKRRANKAVKSETEPSLF